MSERRKSYCLPENLLLHERYRIGDFLGEGGFALTYLGMDETLETKVAVKEFFPTKKANRDVNTGMEITFDGEKEKEFFGRGKTHFIEEAKRLARFFALPGIVSVKDYFEENDTAYIVMEFVNGETLADYLKKNGKMSVEETISLMKPLLESLEKVHEAGVVHKDISPANIMVDEYGNLKLIDFGSAEDDGEENAIRTIKPGYSPMEQYHKNGEIGSFTDIYAISAVIYRMITGKVPAEPLERLEEEHLVFPDDVASQMNEDQKKTLLNGLAVYQKNRIQDVSSFLEGMLSGYEQVRHTIEPEEDTLPLKTLPLEDEDEGKTLPLEDEDAGKTLPLEDEDDGKTLPLEDEDDGKTLPLEDGDEDKSSDFIPPQLNENYKMHFDEKDDEKWNGKPYKKSYAKGRIKKAVIIVAIIWLGFYIFNLIYFHNSSVVTFAYDENMDDRDTFIKNSEGKMLTTYTRNIVPTGGNIMVIYDENSKIKVIGDERTQSGYWQVLRWGRLAYPSKPKQQEDGSTSSTMHIITPIPMLFWITVDCEYESVRNYFEYTGSEYCLETQDGDTLINECVVQTKPLPEGFHAEINYHQYLGDEIASNGTTYNKVIEVRIKRDGDDFQCIKSEKWPILAMEQGVALSTDTVSTEKGVTLDLTQYIKCYTQADYLMIDDAVVDYMVPGYYHVPFFMCDSNGNQVGEISYLTVYVYDPTE